MSDSKNRPGIAKKQPWLLGGGGRTVHVYTYSKSLVNKLRAGPQVARETTELETWELLKGCSNLVEELHIQWRSGHLKLEGNESADRVARLTTKLNQTLQHLDFSSTQAAIERYVTRKWRPSFRQDRLLQAGGIIPNQKEGNLARYDRTKLSQLRRGSHYSVLRSYDTALETTTLTNAEVEKYTNYNMPNAILQILWTNPESVIKTLLASGKIQTTTTWRQKMGAST